MERTIAKAHDLSPRVDWCLRSELSLFPSPFGTTFHSEIFHLFPSQSFTLQGCSSFLEQLCLYLGALQSPLEIQSMPFMFQNMAFPADLLPAIVATIVAALTLVLGICLKRRYLSPLSDIPGPFISSFSANLWFTWHIFTGHLEVSTIQMHRKLGKPQDPVSRGIYVDNLQVNLSELATMRSASATLLRFEKFS